MGSATSKQTIQKSFDKVVQRIKRDDNYNIELGVFSVRNEAEKAKELLKGNATMLAYLDEMTELAVKKIKHKSPFRLWLEKRYSDSDDPVKYYASDLIEMVKTPEQLIYGNYYTKVRVIKQPFKNAFTLEWGNSMRYGITTAVFQNLENPLEDMGEQHEDGEEKDEDEDDKFVYPTIGEKIYLTELFWSENKLYVGEYFTN